jgi:prepilin-type N-terminal cleavage/methylation domain-containing protein
MISADRQRLHSGFSLLELSIVLIVLSLMLGGILAVVTQETRRMKMDALKAKMNTIERAVLGFRKSQGRLPCPAKPSLDITHASFGLEASNPGSCVGGAIVADFTDGVKTVGGTVPVHTLGLPEEYMFDPWGGRFTYIVDIDLTATSAFTSNLIASTDLGSITVNDANGNAREDKAVLAIISHGPNGHGAFQLEPVRRNMSSNNASELQNCDCTNAAVAGAFNAIIVMSSNTISSGDGDVTRIFDDIVKFYTRTSFMSSGESLTETP